jgi:hypothetical protein
MRRIDRRAGRSFYKVAHTTEHALKSREKWELSSLVEMSEGARFQRCSTAHKWGPRSQVEFRGTPRDDHGIAAPLRKQRVLRLERCD